MWELVNHHSVGKYAASTPQQQPLQNRLSTTFNRDFTTINKRTAAGRNIQMSVQFVHIHARTHTAVMKFTFQLFCLATILSISSAIHISGSISFNCAIAVLVAILCLMATRLAAAFSLVVITFGLNLFLTE